jgi:flagellar biogenesis protein FliO
MEKKPDTTRLERVKKILEDMLFFLVIIGVLFLIFWGISRLGMGSAESEIVLDVVRILTILLLILFPVYVITRIIVGIYEVCTRRRR